MLLPLRITGSTARRFEFQGVNFSGMIESSCVYVYGLTIRIDTVSISCGNALKIIGFATRYVFHGINHIKGSVDANMSVDNMRNISTAMIYSRIFVPFPIGMTGSRANRFQFQCMN